MPNTELETQTPTKLALITQRAGEDSRCRFTSLAHLLDAGFLKGCYLELGRDRASGIDNVTWKEYGENLDENLRDLVARMKAKRYKPQPAKRVYIPKDEHSRRPLGLPALEDKAESLIPLMQTKIAHCAEGDRPHSGGDLRGGFPGLLVWFSTGQKLPPGAQCGGQDDHDEARQPCDRRGHQRLL